MLDKTGRREPLLEQLEKLQCELCPHGYKYLKVQETCKVIKVPKKLKVLDLLDHGAYPVITQSKNYIDGYTNDITSILPRDDYILFGDHTRELKWVDFPFAQGGDGLKVLQPESLVSARYLYYALTSLEIPNYGYHRHWSFVKDMCIPVPPIEVQNEIVQILDIFTQQITTLNNELANEKERYEIYRSKLINFNG